MEEKYVYVAWEWIKTIKSTVVLFSQRGSTALLIKDHFQKGLSEYSKNDFWFIQNKLEHRCWFFVSLFSFDILGQFLREKRALLLSIRF